MNIMEQILIYKKEFVAEAKRAVSLEKVQRRAEKAPPTRGFARVLRGTRDAIGNRKIQSTLRVIAEIKRASPSRGVIRANFDPAAIARSYEAGDASALSVLTDEKFFQGSLDCLVQARKASSLPILRKEFMIDPYQVYEARAAGADCILLIAGLLPWSKLARLRNLAKKLSLDVLLEVHHAEEIVPALAIKPDALGINNRNLWSENLKTDLSQTELLMDRVPPRQTLVSESGIRDRYDVERLKLLGVDAILVGEHLMRERDPGAAIRTKLGIGKS